MTELDARRLVRDGTAQDQRAPAALDPASAPVDEHGPADRIVFARAYAAFVRYFGEDDTAAGDWQPFFDRDVSAQLAVAAIADVADYGSVLKSLLSILDSRPPLVPAADRVGAAGAMIGAIGSLAARLDQLKETLPEGQPLRAALVNLIRTRLAPALRRLIAIDKGGRGLGVVGDAVPDPPLRILGRTATTFSAVVAAGLSADWITEPGAGWAGYHAGIAADTEVYGPGDFLGHLANHYAFTTIRTVFLAGYARVASDAGSALAATFQQAGHEPHYALFLAFVRLLEEVRAETNTLTGRHLDFYYRDILRLRERPPLAGHAHLLLEPAKGVDTHLVAAGVPFRAGKDDSGRDVVFTADRDLVVNRARVADRRTVYRHQDGRIFAAPVTEAEDGSWHPFFAKTFENGVLTAITMPPAEIGFAVASPCLRMAEGVRVVTLTITTTGGAALPELRDDVSCRLTTAKGWLERRASVFTRAAGGPIQLRVDLTGDDPAVTGYVAATHGGSLTTTLPVLTVRLRDRATAPARYPLLADLVVTGVEIQVAVTGIRALTLSNDLGPIDPAKAFQPYGPAPLAGHALVVGCAELAGKQLLSAGLRVTWMTSPTAHKTTPKAVIEFLTGAGWSPAAVGPALVSATNYTLVGAVDTGIRAPGIVARVPGGRLGPALPRGVARLRLDAGFGLDQYAVDLAGAIKAGQTPPPIPVVPAMREILLDYVAADQNGTHLFHLTPFGAVEQPLPAGLLPRFTDDGADVEAELYLGLAGLRPPQNIALLVQVQDGTANPLASKPETHVRWSYLRDNRWAGLTAGAVDDQTGQLNESGVLTLAVPADATSDNTVLPGGLHWVRAAVRTASDAVCRLLLIGAQGLSTTDQGFLARPLPSGTISKPVRPDPAIKTITQPFAGFGGRGAEAPAAFATRVSERLRHKDRAVALWDYERLVLAAFPAIYRVRCLNHTRYESAGYHELAAGHVTVVTIPVHRAGDRRDPLRPYTSLGLLGRIHDFLAARMPCFVTLHVGNPQFEEVHVDFRVRLRDGFDETFHVDLLAREITRFLSPWGFTDQAGPTFTGRYATSVLIDFIEERPYVDYVTDFRMFHHYPGSGPDGERAEVVTGSRAVSVLVSAPAERHRIAVIHPPDDEAQAGDCPEEAAAG